MSGAFGRVFSTEALIFVGNGKGLGGYAVGISKANDSVGAIIRAQKTASKRLFYVELLENRTIYQVPLTNIDRKLKLSSCLIL